MTELAFREHPYDPAIRAVINTTTERNYLDGETFGRLAPLLDGELTDPPGGPALTYQSSGGSTPTSPLQIPVSARANQHFLGDWDGDGDDTPGWRIGDGKDTIGVRNKKTFLPSNDNTAPADIVYSAGRASDRVVIGDWNGNGIDAPGLIRGKQLFLRTNNSTNATYLEVFTFARVGDRFVAGDWDGNGTDTLAAVREVSGTLKWFLRSGNGPGDPVSHSVIHGDIHDGALTDNVSGGSADELAVIRYR